MTFLVLGGTSPARDLAMRLEEAGIPVVYALFGEDRPRLPAPPIELVAGGFGGADGLVTFLRERGVHGIVDASHPFAADVSRDAAVAAGVVGVPLVRLLPPAWEAQRWPIAWRWVADEEAAKRTVERLGGTRPFLSLGRDSLRGFADWDDRYVLARVVQPPTWPVPSGWEVIRSGGRPHTYAEELALLSSRRIDVMVTQDTGGPLDEAKLRVAERLGIFVVMIRRPALPDGLRVVQTVGAAYGWVARRWRPQDF
ncbi:precorrin-6A/cobalt-precorrin-6A reductase [Raineyella sp. LH-20]|uniref:precorrin-6A/cobalt-precorrin-6A reductase n=1 Tax=Raineyella sp. LH-20 TaxID=3081204 RepID=UPI002953A9ED|nr:precorrin-6A/cobalt-precorrin-6A reductase [Raineyella sp. LH-20]WOP19376.1 precorrin-6A/cobalt-precorrin-6A reductase [Raineyella sp. LH-20]